MVKVPIKARDLLKITQLELKQRGIPTFEIDSLLAIVEAVILAEDEFQELIPEPYFISYNRCEYVPYTPLSVVKGYYADRELELAVGYSIQPSATKANAFARPYYIDPINGIRRCKGLFALQTYADRFAWDYDLSFVGHKGRSNPNISHGLLADTSNTRAIFLRAFIDEFIPMRAARVRFHLNEQSFFCSDASMTPEVREQLNIENTYMESIQDSRFVLCPRGGGTNSIRFFESLASCNIPIYIGDKATKFPLDWIINWNHACFRISCEEVADGSYSYRLKQILATSLDEINRMRQYIFRIYHQFLAPEREQVFLHMVLFKVREEIKSFRIYID